ncbi:hypothetical protein ACP70R_023936 [Stipagrostis hirtigluma subsp. patula]
MLAAVAHAVLLLLLASGLPCPLVGKFTRICSFVLGLPGSDICRVQ